MAKVKVNYRNLDVIVRKQASKMISPAVNDRLVSKFAAAKSEMLFDFDNHGVTKELGATNPERVDSQYLDYGNLYSLLGIPNGTDIVAPLRAYLNSNTKVARYAEFTKTVNGKYMFTMQVQYPTQDALNDQTRGILPWTSRGVLELIQNGTPGFSRYLFSLVRRFKTSYSGTAIQTEKTIREGQFEGVDYTNEITRNFITKLLS
jgi:hypothetical protein